MLEVLASLLAGGTTLGSQGYSLYNPTAKDEVGKLDLSISYKFIIIVNGGYKVICKENDHNSIFYLCYFANILVLIALLNNDIFKFCIIIYIKIISKSDIYQVYTNIQ